MITGPKLLLRVHTATSHLTLAGQLTRFAYLIRTTEGQIQALRVSLPNFLVIYASLCFRDPMGKSYLKMRTDSVASDLINADFKDLAEAAKKLATHAIHLGSLGFGTTFLQWVASIAAMYVTRMRSISIIVLVSQMSTCCILPFVLVLFSLILFHLPTCFQVLWIFLTFWFSVVIWEPCL